MPLIIERHWIFIIKVADHFYVSKDAARYRLKNLGLLREQYDVDTQKLFF